MSKEFTFHNVTIFLSANNAKDAYRKLCDTLAIGTTDWVTDVYSEGDSEETESTEKLFCSENQE